MNNISGDRNITDILATSSALREQFAPLPVNASLTVGMAAHGNSKTTAFALAALLASIEGDYELILVDDASPDDTLDLFEKVREIRPSTQIFRFVRNQEYSGSLNTLLSHARGERVLFVSNDIFVTPSYVRQLLMVADSKPDAGIVRGCSNFVDNGLQPHNVRECGNLDNFQDLFTYATARENEFDGLSLDDQFLTGDAFLVTRHILDRIGFIDLVFFGYFADHDFGLRARQAGFRPQVALGAFAWHQHGANMNYLPERLREEKLRVRWARVSENWARFKEKYGLPPAIPYQGMRRIPWDGLASQKLRPQVPPWDKSAAQFPTSGSPEWNMFRAGAVVVQARRMMNAARLDEAHRLCEAALELDPSCSEALTVLGSIHAYQGNVDDGILTLRRAVRLDPTDAKAHSNLLMVMNYSQRSTQASLYRESRRWERFHGRHVAIGAGSRVPGERSRIRIGYLSPDFRRHSVAYFFLPLLEHHDRTQFEIFCFSDVASGDETTARMAALADGWRDIHGLANDELEAVVREVAPDILVDLAGHTGQVIRLPLFARKIAPVQVTWLGYPNTTGMSAFDYRLTDGVADPVAGPSDRSHSEHLVRLPHGFLCYRPPEQVPDIVPAPSGENGFVTFGCFNMLPKIQDVMVETWSAILHRVPGSRLVLKNHFLGDAATAARLRKRFAGQSIREDRLDLLPSDPDTYSHLERYNQIDIALDTFPYNGTTTTCEALWMGVPVVTLHGDRHASRVGLSIMAMLGREEFTASTTEEYCRIACGLAADIAELQNIRLFLRFEMYDSTLCDEPMFTRDMEQFFRQALCDVPTHAHGATQR